MSIHELQHVKVRELVSEQKNQVIEFPIGNALIKEYQLRQAGSKRMALEVSVPRDFARRLLREFGVTYEELLERCKVTVYYCGGDELLYQFSITELNDGN